MVSLGIKSIKPYLLIFIALFMVLPMQVRGNHFLQEGDLLFCCTDSANAITVVTSGVGDQPIDHVAIVHRIGGNNGLLYVIEAVKPVVKLTPIDSFWCENPHLLVGRVNIDMNIPKSVKHCLAMVGKPYDDIFLPGDSALYCSELVQLNYVDHQDNLIFDPVPMSFHDATGRVTGYWMEFYSERGMSVPEGAAGSNPGELSRRPQVTIIGTINISGKDVVFDWY